MNSQQWIKIVTASTLLSTLLSSALVFFALRGFGPSVSPPDAVSPVGQSLMPKPARRDTVVPACLEDAKRICSHETSFRKQDACLQDHLDQVSGDCRKILMTARDALKPCEQEIQKYCSTAGYGGGRMIRCLEDHSEDLSGACAEQAGLRR